MKTFTSYANGLVCAFVLSSLFTAVCPAAQFDNSSSKPNVILIITDDLGWGDLGCYGATRIKTPNVDRLADNGRRFTQAYAPSSTCTPSRYAIMTGQYGWRKPPQQTSILDGDAPLCIDTTMDTLPKIFKRAGYATALIGKWHLGLGDGSKPLDYNGDIKPGPLEIGFDSAFFIPATVDRVPCVFIENHRVFGLDSADPIRISYRGRIADELSGRDHPELLKYPADQQHSDVIINGVSRIGYMTGGSQAQWIDIDIADTITQRAVKFIEHNKDKPFFLHFGTHDPHVPRNPNPRFQGKSGCGIRGDAVLQIDWCVGEIMAALDRLKLTEKTLVLLTSDNGPVLRDGYDDGAVENANGHKPAGDLRGWKYLVFEGGTRVPFIASWPGQIQPGVTDQMFCLVDMPATCASLTGQKVLGDTAIDSMDLKEVLLGRTNKHLRETVVQHGISNALAIRHKQWKYIPANAKKEATGMGRGADPNDTRFVESKIAEPLLYNLADDPYETKNVIQENPDKAKELQDLLNNIRNQKSPVLKR